MGLLSFLAKNGDKAGLAGLAGLLASGQSEDADAGFVTRGGKTLLEAFHGSPHKFDRFSMDQIGTGEGAQAYGHGLYFADSEDVARGYRDGLAGSDGYYNGQRIADMGLPTENPEVRALSHATGLLRDGYTDDVRADTLAYFQDDLDQWLGYRADLKDDPDALKHLEAEITDRKAALDAAKGIDYSTINVTPNGHLYRAEIDVTPESLLDWDKPLSEQSEAVQEVLGPYRSDFSPSAGGALNLATDALGKGVPEKMLSERGIKGIRYLDGDSRAVGDGTSNYVIFDDSLINIAERGNADPRLLAGTAAGAAGLLGLLNSDDADASVAGLAKRGLKLAQDDDSENLFKLRDTTRNDEQVGYMRLDSDPYGPDSDAPLTVDMVEVDNPGQGIGTLLYDAVEEVTGRPIEPSSELTEDGARFWARRDPDDLRDKWVGGLYDWDRYGSWDNVKKALNEGNATVPMLAATAGLSGAGLLASQIKDSGMISAPRSENLFNLTMGARDLERRLEGSPASLLFPTGLVEYLETVNRRTEDPNAMTRGMALLDVLPW